MARSKVAEKMNALDKELLALLRAESDKSTQRKVAAQLGLHEAFVSDVLAGKRPVGDALWERAAKAFLGSGTEENHNSK